MWDKSHPAHERSKSHQSSELTLRDSWIASHFNLADFGRPARGALKKIYASSIFSMVQIGRTPRTFEICRYHSHFGLLDQTESHTRVWLEGPKASSLYLPQQAAVSIIEEQIRLGPNGAKGQARAAGVRSSVVSSLLGFIRRARR